MQQKTESQHNEDRKMWQITTFPGVIRPFSSASDIMLIPILKHNRPGARFSCSVHPSNEGN
jgi:hypothetical protein